MIQERSFLSDSQKALIREYKKCRLNKWTAKKVFTYSHSFVGLPKKVYCLYFGFQILAYCDTYNEMVWYRNFLFNNI